MEWYVDRSGRNALPDLFFETVPIVIKQIGNSSGASLKSALRPRLVIALPLDRPDPKPSACADNRMF